MFLKKIRPITSIFLAAVLIAGQPSYLNAKSGTSLQVQSIFNPLEYKDLLPSKVLEYYLQCIIRTNDINSLDVCLNPSVQTERGRAKLVIDLRKDSIRKEGDNRIIFCSSMGDAYEAVIGPDNSISIRRPVTPEEISTGLVKLSVPLSSANRIENIHTTSVIFLNSEHGQSTHQRAMARSEMVGGVAINWRTNPQPGAFSDNVKLLISRLVGMRIKWRESEGYAVDERDLTNDIIDSGPIFAINEILTNAFDACAKAGADCPIMFTISRDNVNNRFIIETSDDGIGFSYVNNDPGTLIAVSNLPKPGTQYELEGGRGIGLMWSKAIVEIHGGSIDILKDHNPGYKTTVRITLPAESLNIEKVPLQKMPNQITQIEENLCSDITRLYIRSLIEGDTSAFIGTHNGERLLVIRNDGANAREGSVIIPRDALPGLWPELLPAIASDNRLPENEYGNFLAQDIDRRTIKFIYGANCNYDDTSMSMYFKLGPGESHVLRLRSTRTSVSRERPWDIPGIDMQGLLPDQRSFTVEESLFVESIDKRTKGKVDALIVRTEDGSRYLIVHDSGAEIKGRTLRVRVHIPMELISDLRADIEDGGYSFIDPFLCASISGRTGNRPGNASIENDTFMLPIQLKPRQTRHYLLAPVSGQKPAEAGTGGAGIDDAKLAIREESPALVSEIEFLERDGVAKTMRRLDRTEGLVKGFIEKLLSSAISSERLVLLFDRELAKSSGVDPLRVLDAIEKLKLRYPQFLKNLKVVVASFDELDKKIAEKGVDWKSNQIFLFASAAERERCYKFQFNFNVNTYVIDDERFTADSAAYYPMLEVVTLALERYLMGEDEVIESLRLLGISYEDLSIESIASDPANSRIYIVTLLPHTFKRDADELKKHYLNLMRLVESA